MFHNRHGAKRSHRWFFKVTTTNEANEAIAICYKGFYALAVIQGALITLSVYFTDSGYANLLDPLLMVGLAWLVQHRYSRSAALTLLGYALLVGVLTVSARIGLPLADFEGRNVVLAALAVYVAYKGVQGTFRYHQLFGSKIIWRNVIVKYAMIVAYNVAASGILVLASLHPVLETWLLTLSDLVLGSILLAMLLSLTMAGAFKLLPGTRAPLVVFEAAQAEATT
jgi:hypothetical protein